MSASQAMVHEDSKENSKFEEKQGATTKPEGTQRYEEGKKESHQANDPKDERSIANRLAKESSREEGDNLTQEQRDGQEDPTLPAKKHGNEPSKGAKIDKELQDEEAEIIAKMDAKKGKH